MNLPHKFSLRGQLVVLSEHTLYKWKDSVKRQWLHIEATPLLPNSLVIEKYSP